jgi:hypothetical protein
LLRALGATFLDGQLRDLEEHLLSLLNLRAKERTNSDEVLRGRWAHAILSALESVRLSQLSAHALERSDRATMRVETRRDQRREREEQLLPLRARREKVRDFVRERRKELG